MRQELQAKRTLDFILEIALSPISDAHKQLAFCADKEHPQQQCSPHQIFPQSMFVYVCMSLGTYD